MASLLSPTMIWKSKSPVPMAILTPTGYVPAIDLRVA